jgi:hypothetical protein
MNAQWRRDLEYVRRKIQDLPEAGRAAAFHEPQPQLKAPQLARRREG